METVEFTRGSFALPGRASRRPAAVIAWGQAMGVHLRTLRMERDLTQQAMADMANLSVSVVSKIERGERPPTIRVLRKLASVLHVDLRDLLGINQP